MRMKKNKKTSILPILILSILSLLNIYGSSFISTLYKGLVYKQALWIFISIIISIIIYKLDIRIFINNALLFYIIGIILLIIVLFLGSNVNGASSWFRIGPISFQPSELFKFFFLIFIAKIAQYNSLKTKKKIVLFTLIPSILIFLEPDTGVVVMYIIMTFSILISSNIKKKYLIISLLIFIMLFISFLSIYFFKKDLFIEIFGTSFFYRIDRILTFANNDSYQLNNALIGLGAVPLFGFGLKHPKIYIPEVTTDFVFDLSILNFGYIIGIVIVIIYTFLLYKIYIKIINSKKAFNKSILSGIFGMMSFQIIEHIFMNLGITPITGITLPFLSYGGSSLLSYYMLFALILKIDNN